VPFNKVQRGVFGILIFLLSSAVASGATFYVRSDGSDGNSGLTNDPGGAWRTIGYAAAHVAAGDTVRVQAGTYVEVASPIVSGTSGNTVTLVADGAVTTCGMAFNSRSYIRVIGFTMDPSTGGCTANSSIVVITGTNTGLEFWNNTLQNTDANALIADINERCNSCIIIGGHIQNIGNHPGSYNAITLNGNDTFIGYVDFNTICYLGVVPGGNRLRLMNLNFRGMIQCATSHPDFIYPHALSSLGYNGSVVESSYGIGTITSTDNKAMHVQPQVVAFNDDIWRLNVTYNMGGAFFSVYDWDFPINRFRFYNNTHVNCDRANSGTQFNSCGTLSAQGGHGLSASVYNNIFYEAWSDAATTSITPWDENNGLPVVTKDYNLAYSPIGSVTFQSPWTGQTHVQSNVNPSFANASSDFTLQVGSLARGAGGALTTTSGSGSNSTTVTVAANTGSFFIGSNASNLPQYGGALVPGDVITVGTTSAQVSSVSGDTLTLASPISWSNGAPVYFGLSSTVDLGAYPYKSGGYALSATYAIVGGTATITPNDASLVRFVVCYRDGVPYTVDNSSPYTCAVPDTGTFSARVYPHYASTTLWVTAADGPSAPTSLTVKQ